MTARWLLVAVPLALGLAWWDAPPMEVFAASLISIVLLVGLTGVSLILAIGFYHLPE